MYLTGTLENQIIKDNHSDFSLRGMVNPTFQNDGESYVVINGIKVLPGKTYSVYAPVVLQNSIPITFESDKTKTRALRLGFVKVTS